ncbi:MAG: hypothetical protein HMLIMOIP_000752 [Candidatus Nitrosomirales archaeon]
MSKRLLIAVAVVIVVIALAIAIPKISPGGQGATNTPTEMRISFVKEDMKRVSFGVTENIGSQKSETLIINNDGTAFYTLSVEGEKGSQTKFQVDGQELKRIRALITETGFMQIPKEQFDPSDNATEFTRYTLTATFGSSTKTIQWVNEESSKDSVPALLTRLKDSMLELIKDHQ